MSDVSVFALINRLTTSGEREGLSSGRGECYLSIDYRNICFIFSSPRVVRRESVSFAERMCCQYWRCLMLSSSRLVISIMETMLLMRMLLCSTRIIRRPAAPLNLIWTHHLQLAALHCLLSSLATATQQSPFPSLPSSTVSLFPSPDCPLEGTRLRYVQYSPYLQSVRRMARDASTYFLFRCFYSLACKWHDPSECALSMNTLICACQPC